VRQSIPTWKQQIAFYDDIVQKNLREKNRCRPDSRRVAISEKFSISSSQSLALVSHQPVARALFAAEIARLLEVLHRRCSAPINH